jgi:hypothetical protein
MFFFEKKNQKTFATRRTLPARSATAVQTFFASFFQKRRPSYPSLNPFTNSRIRSGSLCSITLLANRAQSSIETPRTACFTRGTALAFIEKLRIPNPSNNGVSRGFAAISPHTETGIRSRNAASVAN